MSWGSYVRKPMWPTSLIDDDELGDKKMKEEADGFYGVDMTDCQLFDFNDDLFLRNDESGDGSSV